MSAKVVLYFEMGKYCVLFIVKVTSDGLQATGGRAQYRYLPH